MSYLYNVTDYDGINEWFPSKREAFRAAKVWAAEDQRHSITVVRCQIERLTLRYACRLLTGEGFTSEQVTVLKIEPPPATGDDAAD